MSDIYKRSLIFIVWQVNENFEKSRGDYYMFSLLTNCNKSLNFLALGAAEIYFSNFKFEQSYSGFYPLFPLFSLGLDSTHSP